MLCTPDPADDKMERFSKQTVKLSDEFSSSFILKNKKKKKCKKINLTFNCQFLRDETDNLKYYILW